MTKDMVCIVCPIGCRLTVEADATKESGFSVTGNRCNRGEAYGVEEMTNPTRMVPTTVIIEEGIFKRLPVKTEKPIPKGLIFKAMKEIDKVVVKAPVKCGDVIVENILDTGVNVVASRSMKHI